MGTYIAACTRQKAKWVASIEKTDVLDYLQGQMNDAVQVERDKGHWDLHTDLAFVFSGNMSGARRDGGNLLQVIEFCGD